MTHVTRLTTSAWMLYLSVGLSAAAIAQDVDNPYRRAKLGDWVRVSVSVDNRFAPMKYTVTRKVTAVDKDKVVVTQDVVYHNADGDDHKTFEQVFPQTKTVPLHRLFDLKQQPPGRTQIQDQRTESIQAAGREFKAKRTHYAMGIGSAFPTERLTWQHEDVPLEGFIKSQRISKGIGGDISTETLVAFGRAGDPIPELNPAGGAASPVKPQFRKNSLGMEMVQLAGGPVRLGARSRLEVLRDILDAKSYEEKLEIISLTPPHRNVVIENAFCIGTREVTVAEFRTFVDATGYRTDAEEDGEGGTGLLASGRFGQAPKFTWKELGFPLKENYPVVNVSWNDAQEFCRWLSKKEGAKYRLPTEAEWEYSSRGGKESVFFCGDTAADLEGFANVADQSLLSVTPGLPWPAKFDDGTKYLAEVGRYKPNPYGLHDMHGNALEWCQTKFSFADVLDDFAPPPQPEVLYCLRGGNWFNEPERGGCASRSGAPPTKRMSLIGFRVVMEVKAEK